MQDEFSSRRHKVLQQMQPDSIAVLPGANMKYRNGDTEYPFRQDSNFYYMTGFCEPNAVMVLCKDSKNHSKFILFNQTNDPEAEVWTGKRAGQQGVRDNYGVDEAYDIAQLEEIMPKLLMNRQNVYYSIAAEKEFDHSMLQWLCKAKLAARYQSSLENLIDLKSIIHELRLFKSEHEIQLMRKAAEISAAAHLQVMQHRKSAQLEYQLEAVFVASCMQAGCHNQAYGPIFASGNNGCTLHYVANDQPLKAGDLILVDAAAEYQYYASDITRTFPLNGKFSLEQGQIYQLVLDAQMAGIAEVRPGNHWNKVQEVMVEIIVVGLIKLGIMQGNAKQIIADQVYKKFYMHGSGHWLGLDVHDVGKHKIDDKWRKFEPGMVLTVEPGIYIANNTPGVAQKWLGIAVRIEDDILVTKKGNEVLSSSVPKQLHEIESATI